MASMPRDGIFLIVSASAGYAFLPTLVRFIYASSTFEPTDLAIWRFIFAIPIIWIALGLLRRREGASAPPMGVPVWKPLALGLLYATGVWTAFTGLERIPASVFVVLFYSYPAMVALLSALTGVRLGGLAWLALGMTLLGVVLTVPDLFSNMNRLDGLGVLLALGNAFSVAIYFLLSKRALRRARDMRLTAAWQITGCGLSIFAIIPWVGLQMPENPATWLALLALSSISTAYPLFALNAGIQKIGAANASIMSSLEPVLGMVLAAVFLAELILPVQWLGAGLIVSAVILLALPSLALKRQNAYPSTTEHSLS